MRSATSKKVKFKKIRIIPVVKRCRNRLTRSTIWARGLGFVNRNRGVASRGPRGFKASRDVAASEVRKSITVEIDYPSLCSVIKAQTKRAGWAKGMSMR